MTDRPYDFLADDRWRQLDDYHIIETDRRTVWVHADDGSCIGRFSKFGVDVHNTVEAMINGANQCLDCQHGLEPRESWWAFKNAMLRYYGLQIPDEYAPDFVKEAPRPKLITVTAPGVLDYFGWDEYNGERRTNYPGSVSAVFNLWRSWHYQCAARRGFIPLADDLLKQLLRQNTT